MVNVMREKTYPRYSVEEFDNYIKSVVTIYREQSARIAALEAEHDALRALREIERIGEVE